VIMVIIAQQQTMHGNVLNTFSFVVLYYWFVWGFWFVRHTNGL